MKIKRYLELRLIEALEYSRYSNENTWSFIVRVHDKKINFAGDIKNKKQKKAQKDYPIELISESLIEVGFIIDESHIKELIEDLSKVKLFGYINECIIELVKLKPKTQQNLRNSLANEIMNASYSELSQKEVNQISNYIKIYKKNNCTEHWQVNNIISANNDWNSFDAIRSHNDHGHQKLVKGILPKYFAIVCQVLNITGDDGSPLINAIPY